jgi:hypothetical protein
VVGDRELRFGYASRAEVVRRDHDGRKQLQTESNGPENEANVSLRSLR